MDGRGWCRPSIIPCLSADNRELPEALNQGCANLTCEAEQNGDRMSDTLGNPKFSGKLAAILATAIAGYTAIMGADEEHSP